MYFAGSTEDVLTQEAGECVICFEDLAVGKAKKNVEITIIEHCVKTMTF